MLLIAIKAFDSPVYGRIVKGQQFKASAVDAAAFLKNRTAKKAIKET
jgi:hypothetical protein